jgi:hypothetical protein
VCVENLTTRAISERIVSNEIHAEKTEVEQEN